MTFKKLIYVAALINLLTIGEVLGAITATGKLTQNVTRGKDISIIWKLKSLIPAQLNIYVNTANTDDKIYGFTLNPITKSGVFIAQANKEIEKRSSAAYNYLGNVDGIETGEIVLNITNVTLNDEMVFILFDLFTEIARTNLSVIFPGERRGEVLKKEYPVKQRQVAFQYCGKPEPIVTCTSDGAGSGNGNSDEVSEHCYNYTITLPKNLKPCKKKSINCVVTSYDKSSFPETITARGELSSTIKANNFSRNIEFARQCKDCLQISWEKNIETGECDVRYQLSFLNGTNVTSAPVVLNNNSYSNCSIQAQSIKVSTYVYGDINGEYQLVGNGTSDPVKRVNISCPTTIATTATTTKISTVTAAENTPTSLSEGTSLVTNPKSTPPSTDDKPKKDRSKTVTIIGVVAGVVCAVVLILLIIFFVKRCKKNKDIKPPASISMQEIAGAENHTHDAEANMYAKVDKSNQNQSPHDNKSEIYAKVDKKSKKSLPNNSVSDVYAKVDKKNNSKLPAAAASNDYSNLDELNKPQGAASGPKPPEDFSNMYAQVNKEPPKENYTIYSELGPGGGRVGPKPTVQPSIYAEAKEFAPQYSTPQRPASSTKPGSYKASSKNEELGHDNPSINDDHEEIV